MSDLTKSLGVVSGTAMMLNTVLGAGVLILPGLAAQQIGAISLWTWLLCAAANIPLLMMFARLASRYPEAGGVGHIAGQAFGRFGNLATSFLFLGAVFVGLPSIALTGGYYLGGAFGIPHWIAAGLLVVIATACNLMLPGTASRVGSYVAAAVIALLVVLLLGSWYVVLGSLETSSSAPSLPLPDATVFLPFMLVFFAFTGWEVAIGTSEEFRDPGRDIPRAVFASFVIAVTFYVACAMVVVAAGPTAFGNAPFLAILGPATGNTIAAALGAGAAILIAANLFAAIWAVSRMLFSFSRDGHLPGFLSSSRRGMPANAVAVTGLVISAVIAADALGLVDIDVLFATAGQNFLLIYALSAAAFLKLSDGKLDRAIAALVLTIVAALIYAAGLNFAYPILLVAGSIALMLVQKRHRSAPAS